LTPQPSTEIWRVLPGGEEEQIPSLLEWQVWQVNFFSIRKEFEAWSVHKTAWKEQSSQEQTMQLQSFPESIKQANFQGPLAFKNTIARLQENVKQINDVRLKQTEMSRCFRSPGPFRSPGLFFIRSFNGLRAINIYMSARRTSVGDSVEFENDL
jgi:hypothetical protein